MGKKRSTAEQVVAKLREIEVLIGQGQTVAVACRQAGVGEAAYCRWRKEYGGLKLDQAKRLNDLEKENLRLKKIVADLSLDHTLLKEAASGSGRPRQGAGKRRHMCVKPCRASRKDGFAGFWGKRGPRNEENPFSVTTRMR